MRWKIRGLPASAELIHHLMDGCDGNRINDDASMPYRVTAVEPTPNPNAVKFMLDREISAGSESFLNSAAAGDHPLAKALFSIEGVESLLFLGTFVTVNKSAETTWKSITPKVKKTLASL